MPTDLLDFRLADRVLANAMEDLEKEKFPPDLYEEHRQANFEDYRMHVRLITDHILRTLPPLPR